MHFPSGYIRLWGVNTWKKNLRMINAFELKRYRNILKILWTEQSFSLYGWRCDIDQHKQEMMMILPQYTSFCSNWTSQITAVF